MAARAANATGDLIENATWDPADATTIRAGFKSLDRLVVRGAGGGLDEIRAVNRVAGTTLHLEEPLLPADYVGQAVEVVRLDPGLVLLENGADFLGQSVTFVRGDAVHLPRQVRDEFPHEKLIVTELLRSRATNRLLGAAFPLELGVLRVKEQDSNAGFPVSQFIRIQRGDRYFARQVVRLRSTRDLVIGPPLDPNQGPWVGLEVVTLSPTGISALRQDAADTPADRAAKRPAQTRGRVGLGEIRVRAAAAGRPLRKLDGLEISAGGGKERRVVLDFWLQVPLHPLSAALRDVDVKLDVVTADTTVRAAGTMEGGDGRTVATTAAEAARFKDAPPVRVRTTAAPSTEAFAIVTAATGTRIELDESLPQPAFAAGVEVEVHPVSVVRTHPAEAVAEPGDRLVIPAPEGNEVALGTVVRVRSVGTPEHAAMRKITTAPIALAGLNEPLPASHATDLAVGQFIPDDATRRRGVTAPDVRRRLIPTDPTDAALYAAGGRVHIQGFSLSKEEQEETCAEIERIDAGEIVLTEPVDGITLNTVRVQSVEPTGKASRDGRLAGGTVLVPADPSVELTRLEALQHHELRHAWQAAVLGPFLISLPIPWLTHVGFALFGKRLASREQSVFRNFPLSFGFFDTLFTAIAWGVSGAEPVTKLDGQLGEDRKTVTLAGTPDPSLVRKFHQDARLTVSHGDRQGLNFVDALDEAAGRVVLRFVLSADFVDIAAPGDTVELSMSPFENIRQTVNTWFSLNLEQLWARHIPSAWGRLFFNFLNRDSWLPPFGAYPLAWLIAGRDRKRIYAEQDAGYVSGDVYTTIVLARPGEVYVGQFARLFAFVNARTAGVSDADDPVTTLTVELPPATDSLSDETIAARVHGAELVPGTRTVQFREHRFIPMKERVANVVGVFFSTAHPGTYTLSSPNMLKEPVVFRYPFFGVDFDKLTRVKVKSLDVTPSPREDFYETERVEFKVRGDAAAAYALRFPPGSVNNLAPSPA